MIKKSTNGGYMVTVVRREQETFEKLLKRFKKLVEQEQVISTFMRKSYYMKPSEKRKFKKMKSEMRRKKAELKRLKRLGLLNTKKH